MKTQLRYKPAEFSNRELAFSFSNKTIKMSAVMLGDNNKFWVVCLSDATRLEKAGYEYAN